MMNYQKDKAKKKKTTTKQFCLKSHKTIHKSHTIPRRNIYQEGIRPIP